LLGSPAQAGDPVTTEIQLEHGSRFTDDTGMTLREF
jgi:hypothetical protein